MSIGIPLKTCKHCGVEAWTSYDFGKFISDTRREYGISSICKECHSSRCKENYRKNRKERLEKSKEYTSKTVERRANYKLKYNYGITIDDYDRILKEQNMSCAICGTKKAGGKGRFIVDHNHNCGTVRGLLCNKCNTGLGQFKDSTSNLENAIKYLEERGSYGI